MIYIANPRDWVEIPLDKPLLFEARGQRNIKLNLNSNGAVEVWMNGIGTDDARILIGTFAGREEIKINVDETVQLTFETHDEGTVLYGTGHAPSHIVDKRELEAYTKIEPARGKATEMEQMMLYVRANENKRRNQADAELARLRKAREELEQQVIENDKTPATPAPTPTPDAKDEKDGEGETAKTKVETDAKKPE